MIGSILIIEDSRYLRLTAKRVLTDAGFNVVVANDGEEALRQLDQNPPDLIILDMLLPRLSGEQVLHILRQVPTTASIPVIVLSSLAQCNAHRLKEEGAIAYVEKSKLDLVTGGSNLVRLVKAALKESRRPVATAAREVMA
jgi:CheY-like chemotaxis protein